MVFKGISWKGRFYVMSAVRHIFFRASVVLNACLVLYLCLTWSQTSSVTKYENSLPFEDVGTNTISVYPANGTQRRIPSSLSQMLLSHPGESETDDHFNAVDIEDPDAHLSFQNENVNPDVLQKSLKHPDDPIKATADRKKASDDAAPKDETEFLEPPREVQETEGVVEPQQVISPIVEESLNPPVDSQERKMYSDMRDCSSRSGKPLYELKGDYWVLNNYIPSAMGFRCDESVTYSTHGDYTFLDNLDPLSSRWQGPVSVSVYAPGDDFKASIDTIMYLRNCLAEGIKKYVTFHLFFHTHHVPKVVPTTDSLLQLQTSCDRDPPKWANVTTYRQMKKLFYPVNVARNTARLNAQTYFVVVSDVELYPSVNFIPEFFNMLKKPDVSKTTNPRVYVFPIFEVSENTSPPETKTELQAMLKSGKAIPFHKRVCIRCHNQPNSTDWQKAPVKAGLSVFVVSHRLPPFDKWEPIYVGTNKEPIYDERLSWEGKSDKMSQMYILCTRNYEFHILDSAFLVHRPGIKIYKKERVRENLVAKQNSFIKSKLGPEYRVLYGFKKGCAL